MTRFLRIAVPAVLIFAAAVLLISRHQSEGEYRVDVVFDNSRGLTPGQLVEVAGARVGTIEAIHLTRDYKARIELKIDRRFAPFRKNASCTIRPQGLLAEYYIECVPGTPSAPPLRTAGDSTPTVPVTRTTQPVALTDLFNIWSAPVRDRLSILIAQLGMGTAGRGEELNALLRRSNPSLAAARRVLTILHKQRSQIDALLVSANKAIAPLANQPKRVSAFVREASRSAAQTAAHSSELADSVRRLPALLDSAVPSLQALDSVVRTGTPLTRQLRAAAPSLNRLTSDIGPFARQVQPTLTKLRPVLRQGTKTLKRSVAVSKATREYAHNSRPAAELAGPLFTNLQERGFSESLLIFLYRGAAAAARFDKDSHILPAYSVFNECSMEAKTPVPGCEATFKPASVAKRGKRTRTRNHTRRASREQPSSGTTPAPAPKPKPVTAPVQELLNNILGGSPAPLPDNVDPLLNYLLG
jgi:virulence factor Mce-like protein